MVEVVLLGKIISIMRIQDLGIYVDIVLREYKRVTPSHLDWLSARRLMMDSIKLFSVKQRTYFYMKL